MVLTLGVVVPTLEGTGPPDARLAPPQTGP